MKDRQMKNSENS